MCAVGKNRVGSPAESDDDEQEQRPARGGSSNPQDTRSDGSPAESDDDEQEQRAVPAAGALGKYSYDRA